MGAFSGGLFLAVGLVHLLPEAAANFEESYDKDDDSEHFPYAYVISIASFSLILFIEKIVTDHHHSNDDHHHHSDAHKS